MGDLRFSSNGGCADDGSGGQLVQRVMGRVGFHDDDVSGIFAKADCAEDAGVGDVGGLMSMCFFFFFLLFFGRERKWDSSYHDGGRVVGISLERERESEREFENIANLQNIMLVKKKEKKNPTLPFKQCTITSNFLSTNNFSNSSVQILFELNSENVLT